MWVSASIVSLFLVTVSAQETSRPQNAASAAQGHGPYNFTYEVKLNEKSILGRRTYAFNISVGTPRQTFPVGLNIIHSDVLINNETLRVGDDSSAYWEPYQGYNPFLSTSALPNLATIVQKHSSDSESEPDLLGYRTLSINSSISQDNYTIGELISPGQLTFISAQQIETVGRVGPNTTRINVEKVASIFHQAGFGLAGASLFSSDNAKNIAAANSRGGALQDVYDTGVIRSKSYSLWFDSSEKKSGHLLLGGIDKEAYIGSLDTLQTTVSTYTDGFLNLPVLTVAASVRLNKVEIDLGDTAFTTDPYTILPKAPAKALYDALGADYYTFSDPAFSRNGGNMDYLYLSVPVVPCSYRTNTSVIEIRFPGSNLALKVPISELTLAKSALVNYTSRRGASGCRLATTVWEYDGSPTFLGVTLLPGLYQVHDHDNNAISIALTNFTSTMRDIIPVQQKGGLTAMELAPKTSSNATSNDTAQKSEASVSGMRLVLFCLGGYAIAFLFTTML